MSAFITKGGESSNEAPFDKRLFDAAAGRVDKFQQRMAKTQAAQAAQAASVAKKKKS